MDTLEVLKGLRKIFSHKNRWTKHQLYTIAASHKGKNAPTHPMQFNYKTVRNNSGLDIYQVCVVGGIGVVCHSLAYDQPNPSFYGFSATNDVARALGFYGEDHTDNSPHNQLVNWNNNPKTTYRQFMSRIKKAIHELELEEN